MIIRPLGAVAIIGPRRTRYGTGPFIARELARAGVRRLVVLGSTFETSQLAAVQLRADLGCQVDIASSIPDLLSRDSVQAVVICSPTSLRLEHVTAAMDYNLPMLAEKPFIGHGRSNEVTYLVVRRFMDLKLPLQVNYWWARVVCHCMRSELIPAARDIETVDVDLGSPLRGIDNIRSCLPHACSIIAELELSIVDGSIRYAPNVNSGCAVLKFRCVSMEGSVASVTLRFYEESVAKRRGGFAVNGCTVNRALSRQAGVEQFRIDHGRIVHLNPLREVVTSFIESWQPGIACDWWRVIHIDQMRAKLEEACLDLGASSH